MADALEFRQVRDQKFAAPDCAVEPESEPVESNPDRRSLRPVISKARSDVRVMMLDADELDAFQFERIFRRQILRMQIEGDHRGIHIEQSSKMIDAFAE